MEERKRGEEGWRGSRCGLLTAVPVDQPRRNCVDEVSLQWSQSRLSLEGADEGGAAKDVQRTRPFSSLLSVAFPPRRPFESRDWLSSASQRTRFPAPVSTVLVLALEGMESG